MQEVSIAAEKNSVARPKKSRLRRWTVRIARVLVAVYLLACIGLYFAQNILIFPGAYVHGDQAAHLLSQPDREILELKTPDGHRVAAIFGPALGDNGLPRSDAATRPTLLYFYGNGDCIETSLQQFHDFRELGYNVLIPEYIGYPMSGGKPSEKNTYDTANTAYAHLLTRHDIDPRQIVLVGRSLGSAPAIDLAARKPVEGLVTFSAFTTMDEMARKVTPIFPTFLFLNTHFRNIDKIGRVKCPILMAHGTADDFVPFAMMARLRANASSPVTTYDIIGARHNDIFPIGGEPLLEKLQGFIDSLQPAPPRK